MRIGIQTWGSYGDIQPFLALAGGLRSAGHDVSLLVTSVTAEDYSAVAKELSIDLRPVDFPFAASAEEREHIDVEIFQQADPLKQARLVLSRLFEPAAERMYSAAEALCRNSDLVIGHFFHYPLRIAAEIADRPYASVMLVHSAIPSRHVPPAGMPDLGAWGNRSLWWLVRKMLNRNLKPFADRMRVAKGLAPAKDLLDDVWASPALNLIAVSKALCERRGDWTENHQVCGVFNLPNPTARGDGIAPDLERFLSAGPAPVYASFGSVTPPGVTGQRDMIALLSEAAARAGCRMIIQAPLWRACGAAASAPIHFVTAAPHALVFPRCAAVVHHGGAGTSHSATLAGVPSVVVAHIDEQRFWGRELHRIGVAPVPRMRRDTTVGSLAEHLSVVLSSSGMKDRAQEAAAAMGRENGVARAIALLEATFPAEAAPS